MFTRHKLYKLNDGEVSNTGGSDLFASGALTI